MEGGGHKRPRRRALGCALALLGALLVLELLVRIAPVEAFARQHVFFDPDDTRYVPHPYLAYVPRPSWDWTDPDTGQRWHHNALGLRGQEIARRKPPGTFRIVCLGGSSTYGHTESDDAHTWPARLQERLSGRDVEVINAGVSGRNSYEMVIDVAVRLTDLDPDLYLYYESINDVRLWSWPGLRPDNSHARAVWPVCEPPAWLGLAEQSRLFLVGRRYLTDYWEELDLGRWVVAGWGEKERMQNEFSEEGPLLFRRNLTSLVLLARGHGAEVAFGTQACFLEDLSFYSDTKGMKRATYEIRSLGRELEVPVCDVATAVPQDRTLLVHEVHASDAGAELIAATWADFLLAEGLLNRP